MNKSLIAEKIRHLRKSKAKLSQEEFAAKTGISYRNIQRFEGAKAVPTVEDLFAIADFVGVQISEILNLSPRRKVAESMTVAVETNEALSQSAKILEALSSRGKVTRLGVLYLLTREEAHADQMRALGAGPLVQALSKLPKVP